VVCISHSTGAEGEAVARSVAEQLDYRYVDDEVIEQAGEWAELAPAFVGDVERRKPLIRRMLGQVGDSTSAPVALSQREGRILPGDAELRELIKQVLSSIADEGSVVIVSHAASFALAGRDVLRVLVTASPETRGRRLATREGIDERTATRRLKEEDAGRADYLKRFYGVEQELSTHLDLVVNTDAVSAEKAGELIVADGITR